MWTVSVSRRFWSYFRPAVSVAGGSNNDLLASGRSSSPSRKPKAVFGHGFTADPAVSYCSAATGRSIHLWINKIIKKYQYDI
jgi:hypothetical protein